LKSLRKLDIYPSRFFLFQSTHAEPGFAVSPPDTRATQPRRDAAVFGQWEAAQAGENFHSGARLDLRFSWQDRSHLDPHTITRGARDDIDHRPKIRGDLSGSRPSDPSALARSEKTRRAAQPRATPACKPKPSPRSPKRT
jgi:hypothetical protein